MYRKLVWLIPLLAIILLAGIGKVAAHEGRGVLDLGGSLDVSVSPGQNALMADLPMALGTAFTYQGYLEDGGNPAEGAYDFQFSLHDAAVQGNQIGTTISADDVDVMGGLFSVELDFGDVFDDTPIWLEINVRAGSSTDAYTTLSPRQALTPTPQALFATHAPWSGLNAVPAGLDDGDDDALGALVCGNGQIAEWNGQAWVCGIDDVGTGSGGDITGVFPGVGLFGGGPSGTVTLTLDMPYRLPQACPPLQIAKWTGATWVCALDEDTTYGAGDGLTLAGGQFSVNYGGNGTSTSVSRSDHDHFGESWSGSGFGLTVYSSDGHSLFGQTSGTTGRAVYGLANASSGANYGVYGKSDSSGGTGVLGIVGASSGDTYGVYGISGSSSGVGVRGYASTTSGTAYGIYGSTLSTGGRGVFGDAEASSGSTYGVYGRSQSSAGRGVFGWTTAVTGTTTGVYGNASSTSGRGVYGYAGASSGSTVGVSGKSESPDGRGVSGENTDSGVGVYARSVSGNPIEAYGSDTADREFYVSNAGFVYADGAFLNPAADFAELLPAEEGLEAGDVLVIGQDGLLTRSTMPFQTNLAGIYSTQPGFLGGASEDLDERGKAPLAVLGVVPVKASAENGPITPGDLLTTSATPGYAMRAERFVGGAILGKALQGLASDSDVILVLVLLH